MNNIKNMCDELKYFLKIEPAARERKNKNHYIGILVINKHDLDIKRKGMAEVIGDIAGDILSMDRAWRKTLEENPEFRGSDYKKKHRLEKKVQSELGYNVI